MYKMIHHFKEPLKMHKKVTKKEAFDVALDGALESTFVSAI